MKFQIKVQAIRSRFNTNSVISKTIYEVHNDSMMRMYILYRYVYVSSDAWVSRSY